MNIITSAVFDNIDNLHTCCQTLFIVCCFPRNLKSGEGGVRLFRFSQNLRVFIVCRTILSSISLPDYLDFETLKIMDHWVFQNSNAVIIVLVDGKLCLIFQSNEANVVNTMVETSLYCSVVTSSSMGSKGSAHYKQYDEPVIFLFFILSMLAYLGTHAIDHRKEFFFH